MVVGAGRGTFVALVLSVISACSGSPVDSTQADYLSPTAPSTTTSSEPGTSIRHGNADGGTVSDALHSDGDPQRARLSIPALKLRNLTVVPYLGKTDDAIGTRIQDRGLAASPHGPQGGVGPGGLGNYQITAHRVSSTQAFLNLPSLRVGHRAIAVSDGVRYVYEIRDTRTTSFRSAVSLEQQRAAVPGRPGVPAERAYLTLSTCATPEDHAKGNFWADRFDNPEHRIDKIGVLVRVEG